METIFLTVQRVGLRLQELLVGIKLDRKEVRHLKPARELQLAEFLADAFSLGI